MARRKRNGCCEQRTPWMRGKLSKRVRPDAARALGGVLRRFAGRCEKAGRRPDGSRDFDVDAKRLVCLKPCRAWVRTICSRHPALTEGDAEGAIVSVYARVVADFFNDLYAAYWQFIGNVLSSVMKSALRAIFLDMPADELREEVIDPMACFFLDALSTCEVDPSRLPWKPKCGRKPKKRFGSWSPTWDPIRSMLSLLLMHQGGKVRWPNALLYSPLAYHLRAAGLAEIVNVERPYCATCRRYFPPRLLARGCPDCCRVLTVRRLPFLLGTRHIEDEIASGAAGIIRSNEAETVVAKHGKEVARHDTGRKPLEEAARSEERRRGQKVAFGSLAELWRRTMTGRPRDLRKMAVLFALTDLETVPMPRDWGPPPRAWLKRVGERLSEDSLRGCGLLARSRRFLDQIAQILHTKEMVPAGLSEVNVRVIVSRLRAKLMGR